MSAALRLGTRGSPLALWQAHWVAKQIEVQAGRAVEIVVVKSRAEEFPSKQLSQLGVGVFTAQLDEELLESRIELAVHSMKDLPSTETAGLCIAATPERESPWDAFLSRSGRPFTEMAHGARIGTSSPRRAAQLLAQRPDLDIVPIRGNVATRLRKLEEGLDGTILAHAGLKRLDQEEIITEVFDLDVLVPAVAQGALAVVTREDDPQTRQVCAALEHAETRTRTTAERSFLRRLRGGCQVPAGALATIDGDELTITAVLAAPDGSTCLRGERRGAPEEAGAIGDALARELLAAGGAEIVATLHEGR